MNFEKPTLHLAKWRKASGKSQEKLAEDIGYARGYIAKVETQPQNVTLEFLVAYAIGVGASDVTALFMPPANHAPELRELCDHYLAIDNDQDRQRLLTVARGFSAMRGTDNDERVKS
ncbi:MAG: helix-turn-helix transcriptional regulator [Pseudomonadota bacterium]